MGSSKYKQFNRKYPPPPSPPPFTYFGEWKKTQKEKNDGRASKTKPPPTPDPLSNGYSNLDWLTAVQLLAMINNRIFTLC